MTFGDGWAKGRDHSCCVGVSHMEIPMDCAFCPQLVGLSWFGLQANATQKNGGSWLYHQHLSERTAWPIDRRGGQDHHHSIQQPNERRRAHNATKGLLQLLSLRIHAEHESDGHQGLYFPPNAGPESLVILIFAYGSAKTERTHGETSWTGLACGAVGSL